MKETQWHNGSYDANAIKVLNSIGWMMRKTT